MKSAVSFSNTWRRELCRKYWIVPVLGFLGYCLACILPVLLNYKQFNVIENYASYTIGNHNFLVLAIDILLALITAVCVFNYLHGTSSVTAIHSLPTSRNQLFHTSVISGVFLMILPIAANGVLMMALAGAQMAPALPEEEARQVLAASAIFTPANCLSWMVGTLVIVFFVFTITVLAGILAGTRSIHILLALFLNGLPFVLISLVRETENIFLLGYPKDTLPNWLFKLSPVSCATTSGGIFQPNLMAEYVGASIIFLLLAQWLYNKVKLEREQNACVFPVVADVVCVLLTFICASITSMVFLMLIADTEFITFTKRLQYLALFVVCSVGFYIITRMIADGIHHVFNLGNLKKFGIYAVIIVVFLGLAVFDLTGYGAKVPAAGSVAKITLSNDTIGKVNDRGITLQDASSIKRVIKIQQGIIHHETGKDDSSQTYDTITMTYHLKDGGTLRRSYTVDYADMKTLCAILADKEATQQMASGAANRMKQCQVLSLDNWNASQPINKEDWQEILKAYQKDLASRSTKDWQRLLQSDENTTYLEIAFKDGDTRGLTFDKKDTNLTKVLNAKGYSQKLAKLTKEVTDSETDKF